MRSRAVRLTLTLLAVGAVAAAAYLSWNIERRLSDDAARARDVDARLTMASREALELRAAQHAYVAEGQSEQFWISKVATSTAALEETLAALRASQLSATGQAAIERATGAVEDFGRMDRRAREYASSGSKLLASDVIFSDGLEASQQIVTAIEQARSAEEEAFGWAQAAARRELWMFGAGAGTVAILAILLLVPVGGTPPQSSLSSAPVAQPPFRGPADDLDLDIAPVQREKKPEAAVPALQSMAELQDVADVCVQLARVADTGTVPALLQRTALALDAAGIVLWVADPDGNELTPVASHGYPASVLSRLGTIDRQAENVTAAAFRTGLLQVVKADTISNGAIAAPLVNPAGCIGVLSADVRHDGEKDPARLAMATIVAAQLATLVAPSARSQNRAAL